MSKKGFKNIMTLLGKLMLKSRAWITIWNELTSDQSADKDSVEIKEIASIIKIVTSRIMLKIYDNGLE
jgi:hypothetical protein